jgi:membrane-bound metal-dependent hydrolase YbcI (DUF457 family)
MKIQGVENTIHDSIIKSDLLRVESRKKPSINMFLLLISVVISLLEDKLVFSMMAPVILWSRRRRKVLQAFAMSSNFLIYEVQSIVIDLVLIGFNNVESVDELTCKIITYVMLGGFP